MTATAALITRSWSVGDRICTLTVPRLQPGAVMSAVIEWDPTTPYRLNPVELQQYRAGRDQALADVAVALGITAAVLEV